MKPTLIIPAAKNLPEEMWGIGKFPGLIFPVNNRIVFDYIYEQYRSTCGKINVICYESAEKVHRQLKSYRDVNLHIYDLPELKDLSYTISYGINGLSEPVIINFADTIVDENINETDGDCYFYSEENFSSRWTFFEEENGVIRDIYDKVNTKKTGKGKLFVGVFKVTDAKLFKECLDGVAETDANISPFFLAIKKYSEKHPMKAVYVKDWFDIGHMDKYLNSKLEVAARTFNHITIDKNRGILRKTSEDKSKFIGEILWYLKLPTDVEYARPRIFSYSTNYENPYIEMEYYVYHTVHELFLHGDLTLKQWTSIFSQIKFICADFKRYTVSDENISDALKEMYLDKTLSRLNKLKNDEKFAGLFENSITVNGVKYKSLNDIITVLSEIIPKMLYDIDTFNIIHGDLCFTNIMIDNNFTFVKLIDPRGKFGKYDIYGDFRYELAKLFHSVDGKYDYIIEDLFLLEYNPNTCEIFYEANTSKSCDDIYGIFLDVFSDEIGGALKEIELIESLLFFSMIPLHGENINRQYAMLATAIQLLNRVTDIKET